MKNSIIFAIVLSFSLPVLAVEHLDVVGLIPGVSSAVEFEAIAKIGGEYSSGSERTGGLDIGGYILPCVGDFSSGKLDTLQCYTGREFSNNDSNIAIYEVLKTGFTKKFGAPVEYALKKSVDTSVEDVPMAAWTDKRGNGLILKLMDGSVDTGSFTLFSHNMLNQFEKKRMLKDEHRRF